MKRVSISKALQNVCISIFINVVIALIGGAGIGSKYFKKNIFTSGGMYHYGKYHCSASLLLSKPAVLKDFANALRTYVWTNLLTLIGKVI